MTSHTDVTSTTIAYIVGCSAFLSCH